MCHIRCRYMAALTPAERTEGGTLQQQRRHAAPARSARAQVCAAFYGSGKRVTGESQRRRRRNAGRRRRNARPPRAQIGGGSTVSKMAYAARLRKQCGVPRRARTKTEHHDDIQKAAPKTAHAKALSQRALSRAVRHGAVAQAPARGMCARTAEARRRAPGVSPAMCQYAL